MVPSAPTTTGENAAKEPPAAETEIMDQTTWTALMKRAKRIVPGMDLTARAATYSTKIVMSVRCCCVPRGKRSVVCGRRNIVSQESRVAAGNLCVRIYK